MRPEHLGPAGYVICLRASGRGRVDASSRTAVSASMSDLPRRGCSQMLSKCAQLLSEKDLRVPTAA